MALLISMFIFFGTGTPVALSGFESLAACNGAIPKLKEQLPEVTRVRCVALPKGFEMSLPKGEVLKPQESDSCGDGCMFH